MSLNAELVKKLQNTSLNQKKILVVGDVMLDRYWFGEVNRISPEAPVPVAKINKTEDRLGGAANVARNIASMGGSVSLLSIVGEDNTAHDLKKVLNNSGIDAILKIDSTINTIMKLRVLAKNQQLIRVDFEEKPSHEILAAVLDTYERIIDNYDIIILSDYGKGGLSHTEKMIKLANEHQIPILIDPKGSDYSKYKNATLITPNKNELRDAAGEWLNEAELQTKAIELKDKLQLKHLLVTRSEEGMSLFKNDNTIINYPTVAREVFDVSGAGDTVIAIIALMLANGFDIEHAIYIANVAAGIVIAKLGTATLTLTELLNNLINLDK